MPRTRSSVDRDAKVDEILEVAERMLRTGGYSGLSVAAIAREIGTAQNSIYWYFPTKDHLLAAALERLVRNQLRDKPPHETDVTERVLWFVDRLAELYPLRAAMYERAAESEVVADLASRLDTTLAAMLTNALRNVVTEAELEDAVASFIATVQGTYVQRMEPAERRRLLGFVLSRLGAPGG